MKIRLASIGDISAISDLIEPLVKKYILPTCSIKGGELLLKSMQKNSIESYFEQGYQYRVGEVDGIIVAVIGMKDYSHLYHLFVHEQFQGLGYAEQLWSCAKDDSLSQGSIEKFTVNSALNAVELYKKWGFIALSGIRERSGIKDIPMQLNV